MSRSRNITSRNIARHELLGLHAVAQLGEVTLEGEVCGETKNMLQLLTPRGVKDVPKKAASFRFHLPSGKSVAIVGDNLVGRPHERIVARGRAR